MIGLRASAYHTGSQRLDLRTWAGQQALAADHLQALLDNGARELHVAGEETLTSLGCATIAHVLAEAGVAASDVDLLVVYQTAPCNTTPMPQTSAGLLRKAAGLQKSLVFSVSAQMCVSPLHALRIIEALFSKHGQWRHALLVGMDAILSEKYRVLGRVGIHSDGAGALLVSRNTGACIRGLQTYNEPDGMQRFEESPGNDGQIHHFQRYRDSDNYLWTLITLIRRVLRSAGVSADQLRSVLPHNVNLAAWRQTLAALRIPDDRLFIGNFPRIGHLFGSDVAANIADSGALAQPGLHLVVSSGVGGCFGGFVLDTETLA